MAFLVSTNLRSKIIAAMLAAAALTGLSQAWLGNDNIRSGFDSSLDRQLVSVANMTARSVSTYFENAKAITRSLADNATVIDALAQFDSGVQALRLVEVGSTEQEALEQFYRNEIVPGLAKAARGQPLIDALIPESPAARYLQYHYIAANPASRNKRAELDKARDGSAYSDTHRRFHRMLRSQRDEFGFADLFLIDSRGTVVYSTIKEVDFLADLIRGPYNDSGLAKAFNGARANRATRLVAVQDYSFYLPSQGAPSFFMATPVYSGSEFLGVLAVQLLDERLNAIVNNSKDWVATGLGRTGDVFLIGQDGTLRSSVRKFEEDKSGFLQTLRNERLPEAVIDSVDAYGSPISLVSAANRLPTEGRGAAVATRLVTNFDGDASRTVAMPIAASGLDWMAVAEMPLEEAREPVAAFQRLMMIALAVTVTLTTIGAMILASRLVGRIRRLSNALNDAADDSGTLVSSTASDELGDLSRAGQTLLGKLRERLQAAELARRETDDLLLRFLPDSVVRLVQSRRHRGEEELDRLVEALPDATYVLGRFSGYDGMLAKLPPEQAVAALDRLVQAVDLAADEHGVEKVRTAGDTYFAVAGLSTPRLDHRQRGLAFARDLRNIVDRFARDAKMPLQVKIGITCGGSVSGVIGRNKLAFDIWGRPVSHVTQLNALAGPGEIRTSAEFAEAMKEVATFAPAGSEAVEGLLLQDRVDDETASIAGVSTSGSGR